MKVLQTFIRASLAALFVLLAVVEVAWTQATSSSGPSSGPLSAPLGATPEGTASQGLVAFAFVVGLLLITGILVKVYDMKRKREHEAVMQLVMREIEPIRSDYRIEDQVFVDRMMSRRAA